MRRLVAALAILASASTGFAADNFTIKVTLDARGRGDVYMVLHTRKEQPDRVALIPDADVKRSLFVRTLRASPAEITDFLSRNAFSGVAVSQHVDGTDARTEITAAVTDLRPLGRLVGGEISYEKTTDNFYRLSGTFGGDLASARAADLSALSGTHVTLWIVFPGAVRTVDRSALTSHTADSVTWRFAADRMLAQPRTLDVVVLPRIEGDPKYWLALILGVTALVVIGAAIVLRRGRDARVG